MKKKLKFISIISISYLFLFAFILLLSSNHGDAAPVKQGELNLDHVNFEKNGTVQLNGKWAFYHDQLLTPKQIHSGDTKLPTYIQVPMNNLTHYGNSLQADSGTYRLVIRSDQSSRMFAIKMPVIYTASKLFVNGKELGHSGTVARHRFNPRPVTYTRYFPLHKGSNEIVIQFANYGVINGWGIAKPVLFGTEQAISGVRAHNLAISCIIIIPFFLMGLFYFGHYLQMKRNRSFIFFSLMSLLISIALSTYDLEGMIYIPFPWLPFWMHARLEFICSLLGILMFIYSFARLYQPLVSKIMLRLITVWAVIPVIVDLFSIEVPTFITLITALFILFILIYSTYIALMALLHKMEGSLYLVVCGLSLNGYMITAIVNASSTSQILVYNVFAVLGVVLSLSLLMAQQFNHAFFQAEALTKKLQQIDQLKDEFMIRTAHKFKRPLNGIIASTQTLLRGNKNRLIMSEQNNIQLITRMCYRLSNLVSDILDIEKMNQGMLALKLGPVDLQSLIRIDERFYLKMAHDKGLQMTITIPENLPLVYADGNRLRQVINNLLDNAINYTHRGQVTLSSKQSRNHLEIEITDTGVGIPEAAFPKLFDPFQQADTHMSEGSGLGLALTKKLVELQGGKMWFESEVGVGSTFHFTLPLFNQTPAGAANAVLNQRTYAIAHDAELTLATPYYSQVADASQILVVGNDLDNLKVLIDMLEGVSYAVIAVKDGGDALSEIHRSKPDLVVLDLMKDGLPGFTICQMIREQYSLTELPILMLTTSSINKDIHYAFRSGANDVLERPYNFAEFSARIRGLIMMKVAAAQATNMEVAFLQSQIRPHFLYNVLNSIIALSYENVEHAREMIAQFATYLRSSFDFQNTSAISSLKKELTLVNAYLSIEKTRFQDRIQVSINADPQLDFPLPPLMIQPLIENAVQHGIVKQKKGGKVHLSVLTEKDAYVITVSDNGKGMDEEQIRFALNKERGRSVGLKNINSRLKHFYNTELKIKSVLGKGSYFSMRIPKK